MLKYWFLRPDHFLCFCYDIKLRENEVLWMPPRGRGRPNNSLFFIIQIASEWYILSCWYFPFFCWAVGSFTSMTIMIRGQVQENFFPCLFLYIHYNQDAMAFTIIVNSFFFLQENSDLFFSLSLCPSRKQRAFLYTIHSLLRKNKTKRWKNQKTDTTKKQKSKMWFTVIHFYCWRHI